MSQILCTCSGDDSLWLTAKQTPAAKVALRRVLALPIMRVSPWACRITQLCIGNLTMLLIFTILSE
eukprot:1626022-Pyramimonas_sp.AAC.1